MRTGRIKRGIEILSSPRLWCRSVARFQLLRLPIGVVTDVRVQRLDCMDPIDEDQSHCLEFYAYTCLYVPTWGYL